MNDLPSIALLQQSHAVPKSGEELEVMGKYAASQYIGGKQKTLNDAVVGTVKHAGLSPEQVRRVIEFANTAAYLSEFNKEGSPSRYVDFAGGPADPGEVLRELNSGGGGTVFDRGLADYSMPMAELSKAASARRAPRAEEPEQEKAASAPEPEEDLITKLAKYGPFGPTGMDIANDMVADGNRGRIMPAYAGFDPTGDSQKKMQVRMLQAYTGRSPVVVKHGSALEQMLLDEDPTETALKEAFAATDEQYEYANPLADSFAMRDKLAGMAEHMTRELTGLEVEYGSVLEDLYQQVKQASLEGNELGLILAAWQEVVPDAAYVKTAFMHIGPRLVDEGVFEGREAVGLSLTKTAHVGMVDMEHPIIETMAAYCLTLDKLAETRAGRDEVIEGRDRLDGFITKAAALIPKVLSAASKGGEVAGGAARKVMSELVDNPSVIAGAGNVVGGAVKYAPHIAGAIAAKEVYDRAKYNPVTQYVSSQLPGTQAHAMRQMRLMQASGMY